MKRCKLIGSAGGADLDQSLRQGVRSAPEADPERTRVVAIGGMMMASRRAEDLSVAGRGQCRRRAVQ